MKFLGNMLQCCAEYSKTIAKHIELEYLTIRDIGKDNDIVVKHIVRDGEGKEAGWTLISPRNRRNRQHTFNQGKQRVQFDNPRRNGSQSGAWRDKDGWGGTKVVTYYFNNFPNNIGIEALWKLFMKWGRVVEVFVRGKKNKEGRAFGFVRFKEVPYPQELERRLDQIWIGTYKLRANCTRFLRNKEQQQQVFVHDYKGPSLI